MQLLSLGFSCNYCNQLNKTKPVYNAKQSLAMG